MKKAGTTEGCDGRLEIRLPKALLAELRGHADRRGVDLSEWTRTALVEKLAADRRQAKWTEERRHLDALKKAIEKWPLSVQARNNAQNNAANDVAISKRTDEDVSHGVTKARS